MRCRRCGSEIEKEWKFCPVCGSRLGGRDDFFSETSDFNDMFQKLVRSMSKEMNRMLEGNAEFFDSAPLFRESRPREKSRGFRIRITRKGKESPRVDIKRLGDSSREPARKEDSRETYRRPWARKVTERPTGAGPAAGPEGVPARQPSVTEEPETSLKKEGSSVVVEMKVPGVRSAGDIEITELDKSVEVKAVVGDKAYFKILTKPSSYSLMRKELKDGVLMLVFS
jgi:HSP20 family molecular chaperone IbpA